MEPLWSQQRLAAYWGYSTHTLEHWRTYGIGPKFISLIGAIRYREKEIRSFERLIRRENSQRMKNFIERQKRAKLSR